MLVVDHKLGRLVGVFGGDSTRSFKHETSMTAGDSREGRAKEEDAKVGAGAVRSLVLLPG